MFEHVLQNSNLDTFIFKKFNYYINNKKIFFGRKNAINHFEKHGSEFGIPPTEHYGAKIYTNISALFLQYVKNNYNKKRYDFIVQFDKIKNKISIYSKSLNEFIVFTYRYNQRCQKLIIITFYKKMTRYEKEKREKQLAEEEYQISLLYPRRNR